MERLVAIARWGWSFSSATKNQGSPTSDSDLTDTTTHRITYYDSEWKELNGNFFIEMRSRVDICRDIARLSGSGNNEITEHNWGYDASGGSPALAGTKAFLAHKNTRIVAGIVGTAVVIATLPASMSLAAGAAGTGAFTIGATTITTAGVAEAAVVAASSWAVLRGIDDVGSTAFLPEGDPSLLTQGVTQAASLFFSDPSTAANNLITSIDIATFIVEVRPGFNYIVRGKRVFDISSKMMQTPKLLTKMSFSRGGSNFRVLTGNHHWDASLLDVGELAEIESRMSSLNYTVMRSPAPGGGSGVDGLRRIVYLDPETATRLTIHHEMRHVEQYVRLAEAGIDSTRLAQLSSKHYDGLLAYLEEGALNFEKSLVGASDEWYRRFEQQGWRKKFKQMEQFDAAFKSLIDQIPWKRGDF